MIPLKDILPSKRLPVVVFFLIAANSAVWIIEVMFGKNLPDLIAVWGFTPARIFFSHDDPEKWLTPITSMFMHGGWFHIIGNMWFLWIFGDNVEDVFGHILFLIFYIFCGIEAAIMQMLFSINSEVPMVGASGAVSGILGAYLCFFPRARVVALVPVFFFVQLMEIPAVIFITLWFITQLFGGCAQLGASLGGGIAFWAHIGGFISGWFIARIWKTYLTSTGRKLPSVEDKFFTFKYRRWE